MLDCSIPASQVSSGLSATGGGHWAAPMPGALGRCTLGADSRLEQKVAGWCDPTPSPHSPGFPLPGEQSLAKHRTSRGPNRLLRVARCWPLLGAPCSPAHVPSLVPGLMPGPLAWPGPKTTSRSHPELKKPLCRRATGQQGGTWLLAGWRPLLCSLLPPWVQLLRPLLPLRHCTPAQPLHPGPGQEEGGGCQEPLRVFRRERTGWGGGLWGPLESPHLLPKPRHRDCRESGCRKVPRCRGDPPRRPRPAPQDCCCGFWEG